MVSIPHPTPILTLKQNTMTTVEKAKQYFENNKETKELFATSDGFLFLLKNFTIHINVKSKLLIFYTLFIFLLQQNVYHFLNFLY